MNIIKLKQLLAITFFASFLALAGCEEKGPMEKAGESIDEAVEDGQDAVEDAAEELDN